MTGHDHSLGNYALRITMIPTNCHALCVLGPFFLFFLDFFSGWIPRYIAMARSCSYFLWYGYKRFTKRCGVKQCRAMHSEWFQVGYGVVGMVGSLENFFFFPVHRPGWLGFVMSDRRGKWGESIC